MEGAPSAVEQTEQAPVHAALQQTPSAQKVDWHWPPLLQAAPFACTVVQEPFEQYVLLGHWRLLVQVVGHEALVPSQTKDPHAGEPCVPCGRSEQVPTLPARVHVRHADAHELLQHTPETQLLLEHWSEVEHVTPSPTFAVQLFVVVLQ